jgi:hypothetical protein
MILAYSGAGFYSALYAIFGRRLFSRVCRPIGDGLRRWPARFLVAADVLMGAGILSSRRFRSGSFIALVSSAILAGIFISAIVVPVRSDPHRTQGSELGAKCSCLRFICGLARIIGHGSILARDSGTAHGPS